MSVLDDLLEDFIALPEGVRAEAEELIDEDDLSFDALPGPQTDAYVSKADMLLYGGAAGGGKSFLAMGLAAQEHQHSIISVVNPRRLTVLRRLASKSLAIAPSSTARTRNGRGLTGGPVSWLGSRCPMTG